MSSDFCILMTRQAVHEWILFKGSVIFMPMHMMLSSSVSHTHNIFTQKIYVYVITHTCYMFISIVSIYYYAATAAEKYQKLVLSQVINLIMPQNYFCQDHGQQNDQASVQTNGYDVRHECKCLTLSFNITYSFTILFC